jgi:uroporphyrinogen-III synthase
LKIKKILVSQPKPTSEKSPYFDIVEKYGVKIDFRPFIKVEPVPAKEFRQQKVSILEHTAVMFTAKTGIDNFFRICEEMRITMPESMKYFCISESVALYLQKYIQYRKRKVFFGTTGKLPDLFTVISKHLDEDYLVVLSDVHNEEILNLLDKNKVKHDVGIMYRTVSNDFTPEEEFNYDMLIFFSPQGIASLLKNFPEFDQGEIQIGCFGATTANAVRDAGLRLDLEAPRPDIPSMTMALDLFLKENHKNTKK